MGTLPTCVSSRLRTWLELLLPYTTVHGAKLVPSGITTIAPTTHAFAKVQLGASEFGSKTHPSPTWHESSPANRASQRLRTQHITLHSATGVARTAADLDVVAVTDDHVTVPAQRRGVSPGLWTRAAPRVRFVWAHRLVMLEASSMRLPLPITIGWPGCVPGDVRAARTARIGFRKERKRERFALR